ncbi:methionyl-tRNA formyltransferase [Helicobacter cholecystus]|uniref:Methionyl-tRNA formyltransferase n=1 Tax=Helicobacter cholecystus TaxID=45498 RepID=A0A3D8IUW5_9HELI|nr:methionyl-tRNA formyltransferase [Helicobacter cholecystus]RDU68715.1 methionyl-tRNA formyltransferase [Helicobacter cholecystus]VEJ26187.1 Methionyl-tRNA formyltransferase [Helicobacter cholecystus]
MKIAFFGTPFFARVILQQVSEVYEVVAVITQPDKPFGRKQELKPSQVKEFALHKNFPLFQPEKLENTLLQKLEILGAEVFVVVAFGQFFPPSFLNAKLCLNVHASLLPLLRGASPLQEMILEDKKNFGVSVMKMDEGMDSGDIMALSYLLSSCNLPLEVLLEQMAKLGGKLLLKTLDKLKEIEPMRQIHCDASYCKKIKKEEGRVDFSSGKIIVNKLLAFSLWPSVFLANGLKIIRAEFIYSSCMQEVGRIEEIGQEEVRVACGDGILKLFEVQPPSKQKMKALDYVRGKRLGVGEVFC